METENELYLDFIKFINDTNKPTQEWADEHPMYREDKEFQALLWLDAIYNNEQYEPYYSFLYDEPYAWLPTTESLIIAIRNSMKFLRRKRNE